MQDQQKRRLDAIDGARDASAHDRTPRGHERLQAGDVAASNVREGGFLGQRINVLLGRGLPDAGQLVDLLTHSTPEERAAVAADAGLMDRLIGVCPLDTLPAVLQLLIDDPKWALYHYLCRRGGRDPDAARALLAGADTAQKLEIVRWSAVAGRLYEVLGDGAGALLGAALGEATGSTDGRAADLDGALATMARDRASAALGLSGRPSIWQRVVERGPAALDATGRQHLDRIALDLRAFDGGGLEQAFALRFGVEIDGAGLDEAGLRGVWSRLAPLDPARVDRHVVERACRDPFGGAGWQVADFVDETTRDLGPSVPVEPPTEARTPADRAAAARTALLDAFTEACGGDIALREAAAAFLDGGLDVDGWRAAVDAASRRGVLGLGAAEVVAALRRLRAGDAARISVAGPSAAPRPATDEGPGALPAWIAGLDRGPTDG